MAFTVETGAGLANANSYASVAAADSYLTDIGGVAAWTALTTAQKQAHLVKATRYLDSVYGKRFGGVRMSQAQGLLWPRAGVVDRDGYTIEDTVVPTNLVKATVEMAQRSVSEDILPDLSSNGVVSSESITVGPISKSYTYVNGKTARKRYPIVDALVADLLGDAASSVERA